MIASKGQSAAYLLATLGYMGVIFYLSSMPGSATGPDTPFWRFVSNAFHIPLFAGLGFCIAMALGPSPWRTRALNTLGIGLTYSIFDEWYQSWSPGRWASFRDVLLDMTGIALSLLLLWLLSRGRAVPYGIKAR